MKKYIILIALSVAVCLSASAQSSQRQKMIHMAAVRIAENIQVKESDKDAFIKLYQNYKKETAAVVETPATAPEDPDKAAEAKILSDFDKSAKLLALRKTYYFEFRKILSPTQIQKMYDAERTMASQPAR